MAEDEDRRAELLRQFEAVISGAELDDLRELAGDLSRLGSSASRAREQQQRPELRRPPLTDLNILRIRVDLTGSKPPIWRRLELRSDLTLDVVHRVLQAAFSWTDSHLWRFSLGGDPFGLSSQVFLCPWDVEEHEPEDDGAPSGSEVRLDEVIQEPGDILSYVYDYGDNWDLRLRLEHVAPVSRDAPSAVIVDGRRAAPPEDCGGITSGDDLAEVIEDPARFDLEEVAAELRSPFFALIECGLNRRLIGLLDRLAFSPNSDDITRRASALIGAPEPPDDEELRQSLLAFTWFLDRAADSDIPLTAAGYLKPVDVLAAGQVVPTMNGWIGKANRESDSIPILRFREALQSLGLLRKYKGTLRLTRAGALAQRSPEELWNLLADKLAPKQDDFEADATLLLLAYAATSPGDTLPTDEIAACLMDLGWRTGDGHPITSSAVYWLPAVDVLLNVAAESSEWRHRRDRWTISPAAARLARAALRQPGSA